MNNEIKIYLIILVIFLVIDIPMITIINKDMYMNHFDKINKGPMIISNNTYVGAVISYLLLALGLYLFVIKQNNSIINGALFGLVVYGIYNYTNLATINEYQNKIAIVDTLWGTFLCGLIVGIYNMIKTQYM